MLNVYRYEQIDVGMSCDFQVEVTQDAKKMFAEISGDENPLHTDKNYATSNGFQDEVVYGMLTVSFFSRLVGMYLPGKYCILQKIETTFTNPVYVGDELTVSGTVSKKHDSVRRIVIDGVVSNQRGEKVCKAKISVGCLK